MKHISKRGRVATKGVYLQYRTDCLESETNLKMTHSNKGGRVATKGVYLQYRTDCLESETNLKMKHINKRGRVGVYLQYRTDCSENEMSLTNCTNFTKSKSVTYNYFKHFLKCTELLVKENGKEGIAHLGSHVKQNSAHSHGLFNIKQSSLVLSSGNIVELHNQFVLQLWTNVQTADRNGPSISYLYSSWKRVSKIPSLFQEITRFLLAFSRTF